jgi:hypothetical protein
MGNGVWNFDRLPGFSSFLNHREGRKSLRALIRRIACEGQMIPINGAALDNICCSS